ncbi:MAG: ankyrin repeat domain-containing protein [Bacteroidota bacterium]
MQPFDWTPLMPLAEAIGWTLLSSIWQIALISTLWRVVLWMLPSDKANHRYNATLAALSLTVFVAVFTFSQEWEHSNRQPLIVQESNEVTVGNGVTSNNSIVEREQKNLVLEQALLIEKSHHPTEKNTYLAALCDLVSGKQIQIWTQAAAPFIPYLAILWYIGVLCFSLMMIGGFVHLKQLRTIGISTPDAYWQRRFLVLKNQLGIRREVQFLLSNRVVEPLTFYVFKPVVLAPVHLMTGLSAEQIEVLLLHELAHIRRFDYLINIIQSLIEILFFYHPAVWWMSRELRKEREHCCDDLVVKTHQNPLVYAEALTCIQSPNFLLKKSLAMAATGKKGVFSQRIFRLFGQYDHQPTPFKSIVLGLMLLLSGLFLQSFYQPSTLETTDLTDLAALVIEDLSATSTVTSPSIIDNEPTIIVEDNPLVERLPSTTKIVTALPRLSASERQPIQSQQTMERLLAATLSDFASSLLVLPSSEETPSLTSSPLPAKAHSTSADYTLKKDETVFIDWSIPANAQHVSANKFKKWSDKKVLDLYQRNVEAHLLSEKNKLQTEGSFQGVEEFDPLIYTITNGTTSRNIELKTYVNHQRKIIKPNSIKAIVGRQKGRKALKDLDRNIPFSGSRSSLKGNLPKYVTFNTASTMYSGHFDATTTKFTLDKATDNVLVQVRKINGPVVEVLQNAPLSRGNYEFTWRHDAVQDAGELGDYQLDITIDGQTLSQRIEVRDWKKANKKRKGRKPAYGDNCPSLLRAVKAGNTEKVKQLLVKVDPNCICRGDGQPRTSLVAAARNGDLAISRLLIEAGAKVSHHDVNDENPLMAAAHSGNLALVKLLVNEGANVNQKLVGDGTALLIAAREGHLDIVQYLIGQKAEVNTKSRGDGTALICAVRNRHYEVSKLLLENGADPFLSSSGDENPIYHASENRDSKMLDLLMAYRGK